MAAHLFLDLSIGTGGEGTSHNRAVKYLAHIKREKRKAGVENQPPAVQNKTVRDGEGEASAGFMYLLNGEQ
jgi:hypothetical protein